MYILYNTSTIKVVFYFKNITLILKVHQKYKIESVFESYINIFLSKININLRIYYVNSTLI